MEKIRITSRKNEIIKKVAALSTAKGRSEQNAFFCEGLKLYKEGELAGIFPRMAFAADSFQSTHEIKADILYSVTDEVYEKLSEQSSPEGLLCVYDKFELTTNKQSATLLLENMQDPGNLGTILRSAAAFGARQVIGVSSCDLFSPKTVRASMGAVFKVPYKSFESLDGALEYLGDTELLAAALTDDAVDFLDTDTSHSCIMIGNEGHGLSQKALEKSHKRIIIPISDIESLNAATASAILLYDSYRKRTGK